MNGRELKDYYGLLGIAANSTVGEIHKAYWKQAARLHPDRGGSHEQMVQLTEAWKILSAPDKRARYDQLLKYRHEGWQSRKFNADVLDARKRAQDHASSSWAEFEEIYQKAFYTFNQDFYGEEIDGNALGPYSPLMKSGNSERRVQGPSKSNTSGTVANGQWGTVFACILKTALIFATLAAALTIYNQFLN